jgi:hypothetical protein
MGQSKVIALNEDKTIRLYDFIPAVEKNKFKCVVSHNFIENPMCVAIHPFATQISVGFKEGLKIYYPIEDDLRQVFSDNLKGCHSLAYNE